MARPQVDGPLLAELLGRDGDEVFERLYLAFDVVRQPAGPVGDPLPALEDDHLQVGVVTLGLARSRHPRSITADNDERAHTGDHARSVYKPESGV